MDLYVASSRRGGPTAAAWCLVEGRQIVAEGTARDPGRGARAEMIAILEGLEHGLRLGDAVVVHSTNDNLVQMGAERMARWRDNGWRRRGGPIHHLDLVVALSNLTAGRDVTWQLAVRTLPHFARARDAARAACAVDDAPTTRIVAYTDGGCRGNPGGVGGWAFLLIDRKSGAALERRGGEASTTNNRMEMVAAIEALRALKGERQPIEIRTDSSYLLQTCDQWMAGWKRRGWRKGNGDPIKNRDLVEALDALITRHQVQWHKVRGHSGDPGNDHVDRLCNVAMDALEAGRDPAGEVRHPKSPVRP